MLVLETTFFEIFFIHSFILFFFLGGIFGKVLGENAGFRIGETGNDIQ